LRSTPNFPQIMALGVGEKMEQIQPFSALLFAQELLNND